MNNATAAWIRTSLQAAFNNKLEPRFAVFFNTNKVHPAGAGAWSGVWWGGVKNVQHLSCQVQTPEIFSYLDLKSEAREV